MFGGRFANWASANEVVNSSKCYFFLWRCVLETLPKHDVRSTETFRCHDQVEF